MNRLSHFLPLAVVGLLSLQGSGCLPKPSTVATRSYLLAPLPAASPTTPGRQEPAIGVGIVKMPAYLLKTSLAVRAGTNEITYLESSLWAERLDLSFQRTLAANLSTRVPTDRIRLSSWSRHEVDRAVYVSVDRFDVDAQGSGTISAWWRITSASGDKTLQGGEFQTTRPGTPPSQRPDAVALTLSDLTAALSEEIAKALRNSLQSADSTPSLEKLPAPVPDQIIR